MKGYRLFHFDRDSGEPWEYAQTIRAALDDEGLELVLGQRERLVVVTRFVASFGREMDVVCVPGWTLTEKWEVA